ncbi:MULTISPECIES: lysylphosphatidylglycerol synthase transmembrane domain-containing protein [unclassified Streptomyces]|uniref:lysylphosphatidylglycerol synthase transmembrane domain-containing protein n=1 Tax=unclassified Streptomyces TaxID=2593676 RepID=UPI001BEBD9FF|nr:MULTISPECIES: lysylphosphatidylglycerol synthase transmembrane domain-containing protein [unclassified Streptomyces]MBT2408097.1 flippase-like domain-containing protein [Streptomyces sp. ISL-21]MBT2609547.1 flippase-like domain-containing protein [Streptomyces sp. ISL-87]
MSNLPTDPRTDVPPAEPPNPAVGILPDEFLLSVRARRPEALIRLLLGLVMTGLTLLLAGTAPGTTSGLDADLAQGAGSAPHLLVDVARRATLLALVMVPVAFVARRFIRREARQVTAAAAAAVLAYPACAAFGLWAADIGDPLVACVFAFTAAARLTLRPRWRGPAAAVLVLHALVVLAAGDTAALGLVQTLLIGWTIGHGTAYAVAPHTHRPTGRHLFASLRQVGLAPARAYRQSPGTPLREERRRYLVHQEDSRPDLDVVVLDSHARASGFLRQAWQRIRVRTAPRGRGLQSIRTLLEHEALLSYAGQAAGVRTRRLLATAELGPDAALAVYEHLAGRRLDELADAELTDQLLSGIWVQVNLLHRREIAHRVLVPESVLVDSRGRVHLVDLERGEVAAGDLLLRIDIAQLLTTTALRTGPRRAVAAAIAALGPDRIGAAVPLLQPLALSRDTRAALKRHREQLRPADGSPAPAPVPELLTRIREEILRARPQADAEPLRLERLRTRTLVTVLGAAAAGYVLLLQLSAGSGNPFTVIDQAQPGWVALAALASAASYLAATMGFTGFVPERLKFGRAGLAQLAGSFVNLVSPSGLGGAALNVRFLQRAGIPAPQALSSVGVTQAIGLVLHTLLVVVFGALASTDHASPLPSSTVLTTCLLSAAVLAGTATAVPVVRRWLAARLRPLLAGVLPRLLDLLQNPAKLAMGVAGQLLISLASVACLYCCTRAFGLHPGFAAVAVANLVGVAVGSAIPTPGGVGGVEAALPLALERTAGIAENAAIAPVLLFRLLTFWLPVLPGWLAFLWLQRRKAI